MNAKQAKKLGLYWGDVDDNLIRGIIRCYQKILSNRNWELKLKDLTDVDIDEAERAAVAKLTIEY